ncbi:TPA: DsbC family protein [Yersinia enterocolitica]|nr:MULTISPECIES: DsbC family protein [Yersinia]
MQINKMFKPALLSLFIFTGFVHAQTASGTAALKATETPAFKKLQEAQAGSIAEVKAAQDEFKQTFSQMNFTNFAESPVKGIYELHTGGNVIYFTPKSENRKGVIIFGEMWDSNGVSLTNESKLKAIKSEWKKLPVGSAISIGDKNSPSYYEITDPDCPYCHSYHEWIKDYSKTNPVQRNLIFMLNPGHPEAPAKIEHIICSKDKEQAINDMFEQKPVALEKCPEAKGIIQQHQDIVKALGVNGTPSFVFDVNEEPELIVGFNKSKVMEAITKAADKVKAKTSELIKPNSTQKQ